MSPAQQILTIGQQVLPTTPKEKRAAVSKAIELLKKENKDPGLITSLGAKVGVPMPHIPTSIAALDFSVLGIGGMPKGRIIEIFGPEGDGKTTLALTVVAQAQKAGGLAAYVDAEHALDPSYAAKLGVDVENLLVSQPDYGEQALNVAGSLIETGGLDICVVDSVSALVPLAELNGDMEDAHMGLQARLMSKAMRKLVGITERTGTVLIFINQIREKIGVIYGNPQTTSGGRGLKFAASVRLDIRRSGKPLQENENTPPYGHTVKVEAKKNKVFPPFRKCEFDLIYGVGFDGVGSLIDLGVTRGVIEKSGSHYSYKGERLGQGLQKASAMVGGNETLLKQIRDDVSKANAALVQPEAV
jgi:recombination protein RecA